MKIYNKNWKKKTKRSSLTCYISSVFKVEGYVNGTEVGSGVAIYDEGSTIYE